jgi:hypothetical protein
METIMAATEKTRRHVQHHWSKPVLDEISEQVANRPAGTTKTDVFRMWAEKLGEGFTEQQIASRLQYHERMKAKQSAPKAASKWGRTNDPLAHLAHEIELTEARLALEKKAYGMLEAVREIAHKKQVE